jgi:hypothetical protein
MLVATVKSIEIGSTIFVDGLVKAPKANYHSHQATISHNKVVIWGQAVFFISLQIRGMLAMDTELF